MLCGQCAAGKTTFAKKYIKILDNAKLISFDECAIKSLPYKERMNNFIQVVNDNINNYDNLICDFCFLTKHEREFFLQAIIFPKEVNFNIILLRPSIEEVIENTYKRSRNKDQYRIDFIINKYYKLEVPAKEEFIHYNFNSIKILKLENETLKEIA